jgi:ubiquitin
MRTGSAKGGINGEKADRCEDEGRKDELVEWLEVMGKKALEDFHGGQDVQVARGRLGPIIVEESTRQLWARLCDCGGDLGQGRQR